MLLQATSGRLTLALRLRCMGRDIQASLTGGDAHVGGVALAAPGFPVQMLSLPGHRDAELACRLAQGLATGLDCTASVSAGVHYAALSREEIEECRRLTDVLMCDALIRLGAGQSGMTSCRREEGIPACSSSVPGNPEQDIGMRTDSEHHENHNDNSKGACHADGKRP